MGRPTGAFVCGPLQPLVRGFLLELIELGYSWTAQRSRLRLMAELSSWMAARGIGPEDLTRSMIEEFLGEARSFCLGVQWCSPTSERQVLAYLRGLGLVAAAEAPRLIDVDLLVAEFVEYLVRERGLVAGSSTVRGYEQTARLFLAGRVDPGRGGLGRLTAADVSAFVLGVSPAELQDELGSREHASGAVAVPVPGGVDAERSDGGGAGRREVAGRVAAEGASCRSRGGVVGELRSDDRGRSA